MRIDLHSHSTASDGTDAPEAVVRHAVAAGLDVLALTDHDTVAGLDAAVAALPSGMVLVPGAEISCAWEGVSLHLLAYLFDRGHRQLAAELVRLRDDRERRARLMTERCAALGAAVSWEQVQRIAGGGAVGRPHVARALVEAGAVTTMDDAFSPDWIGQEGRAYVEKHALDPCDAIRLVRDAGGVPVFAHPRATSRGRVVGDEVIRAMAEAGLAGLEVDHPDHTPQQRAELLALAADLRLLVTGSSDDHGGTTGHRLGCETTEAAMYRRLLDEAKEGPLTA